MTRVYVETALFSGYAKVVGIVNCAFYPIMVELEEPDADGHRYKRVATDQLRKITEEEGD